jgi:hypothetical protein
VGFEPVIPVIEEPHTYVLDGAAIGLRAEEVVQYFWRPSSSRKVKRVSALHLIRSDVVSVMWESLDWSWGWAFLNNSSARFDIPRLHYRGFNGRRLLTLETWLQSQMSMMILLLRQSLWGLLYSSVTTHILHTRISVIGHRRYTILVGDSIINNASRFRETEVFWCVMDQACHT